MAGGREREFSRRRIYAHAKNGCTRVADAVGRYVNRPRNASVLSVYQMLRARGGGDGGDGGDGAMGGCQPRNSCYLALW
jgi:hypothetical protein